MDQLSFADPTWYHAIALSERIASLRAVQYTIPQIEEDTDLAERRMQRWRSQRPFRSGSHFAQRLAMDGISEEGFLYLLGEPIKAVHGRFPDPPPWLAELAEAFSRPVESSSIPLSEASRGQQTVGFLDVIEPLIRQGRDRLHQGVQAFIRAQTNLPFDPGTVEVLLLAHLPGQLIPMLTRTMVLELQVARLQGLLPGETAEERFQAFLARLRQRETALAFLQEYPVLARQLVSRVDQWVRFSLEFLQHLCADWEAIRTMLTPKNDPGVLVQVHRGMSASHPGARSVLIARFSSGVQVVYKPWPMAVDRHFQELLTWLNNRGNHPPFRTLTILDRDTYGWVEFVAAQSCSSAAEVRRFYERQGAYLALLYALEGVDFRFENLIAEGEHPVLIDLDTLFHARERGIDLHHPDLPASKTMAYSVIRVGLLPQRLWSNAESEGIDISGLGGTAGQLTPEGVPCWEGTGTDEMRLARKRVAMLAGQHRPTLNGAEIDVLNYTEAIAAGFTALYQLLLKHREELLADDGPLARFAEDTVRVIVRPGRTYGLLLQDSYHPDVLRDALDRDRFFDRLWVEVEHRPYLARVIPAEREDLQQGDMPIFRTRPGSLDLWSSTNERITGFFDEPGIALVKRRVRQLGEKDLSRQLWFIRASLATLATGPDRAGWPACRLTEPQTIATREQLLITARAVGDRLEALALRGADDVSWIGLTHTHECYWSIAPLEMDLYDGLPGVALFLAYLGAITREECYTVLACDTATTLRRHVERSRSFITAIGAFNGWGGLIYTLAHLGALWHEPALLIEAQGMVERLPELIEGDEKLDIISGAAGCIGSLLSLYRCAPSERVLAAAIQCGDHLIARAQSMEYGIGWTTKITGITPLTGFSHGAAGIAWVLLELAALTGEERFRTAALGAIAYERSLFLPEDGNWPDLRDFAINHQTDNNRPTCMTAWCHGAPGIGLARLQSLQYLNDAETRSEINAALKTTLTQGCGHNHSLCHGDLGNLELLLQASEILDDPQWRHQVNRIAAMILESIDRNGWLCGIPLGVESPGLMTGIAGIGYELLRLAEPTRVPSVLLLEPPRSCL